MTRGGQLANRQSKSAYVNFSRDHDSHERHSSSRKHRRRSRSRSSERDKELRIQMKPLVLASENDSNRQSEISYIEGSSFIQKGFSSSRKLATMIQPDSHSRLTGVNISSSYHTMLAEKAHEAAIFGHSSVLLPSFLGTDPAEAKERLVSSLDTVRQLIHHTLDKSDSSAWNMWLTRLTKFKERRANMLSRSNTFKTNQKKKINGFG
uniref:Uncharacterized protein n=1 Tax=Trichobilharzia regenti TaxID=157069 RepID=A0AA85JUM2_TRIRE|nr:unnamed protein product [Trichobilharzia regenti]